MIGTANRERNTMRAIIVARFGGPDVLEPVELPMPEPGPGEVLIEVAAAAVNYADTIRRRGLPYPMPTPLPFHPGSEVAGVVAALGDGVSGPPVGTPVFALVGGTGMTGYAEFALAQAAAVIPVPPAMPLDQAAGTVVAGLTALLLLADVGRLAAGESVFVPAAAGGVGSIAVQIARHLGASRIVAGVGSNAKVAAVNGAAHDVVVMDPGGAWVDTVLQLSGGIDVALEMTGGDTFDHTAAILAPFGRLLVYGTAAGTPVRPADDTLDRWLAVPALGQSVHAFNLGAWFGMRPVEAGAAVGRLLELVATGVVQIPVGHRFPLEQAADAHRLLESRESTGKIVLVP
jgi:NADPH:quinone reductase